MDDADGSTFNFGSDVPRIIRWFSGLVLRAFGCRAIDSAREFGAVQAIPVQDRIIHLREMPSVNEQLAKALSKEPEDVKQFRSLPAC